MQDSRARHDFMIGATKQDPEEVRMPSPAEEGGGFLRLRDYNRVLWAA